MEEHGGARSDLVRSTAIAPAPTLMIAREYRSTMSAWCQSRAGPAATPSSRQLCARGCHPTRASALTCPYLDALFDGTSPNAAVRPALSRSVAFHRELVTRLALGDW